MNLAVISLVALLFAILISCTMKLNVGILSIVLAWIIGVYLGKMSPNEVIAGFPTQLFFTLAGVTLLFTQAQTNGTLPRVAYCAVQACQGHSGLIPILFFFLGAILASMGPGNIATAALLAPIAMAVAGRMRIPVFLMAIMVGNGANAGSLSPFAPTGIIVNNLMNTMEMSGVEWLTYLHNLFVHTAVAFTGYFLLGGWKLFRQKNLGRAQEELAESPPFQLRHWVTLTVIGLLVISVIFFNVHVGMGAFAGAAVLTMGQVADGVDSIRKMPWSVILMVTGVTVLISLLETTGGLDLFTELLARTSTAESVTGMVAFITGLISVYSSTSGVVLPAFLPTVPGLAEKLGAEALAIASSMNIGSHLVDLSPVSTIGALCLASVPSTEDVRALFNRLLMWGMSMTIAGGIICYICFG